MNKYIRGGLIAAGIALASLYSPGCKSRDEPIVVRPRTNCNRDCDHDNYVHAKPARNISLKNNVYAAPSGVQYIIVVPRQAPELSRYNSFNDPNARENARNVVGARDRRQHPLGGSWVINPGTSGSGSGAASGSTPQRGSEQLMPNPYTGCGSGSSARTRNPNTDPCYDASRTVEERARACAERLPTADEAFGPGEDTSLEQRLRDCEELNRQLEQQATDAMNPDDDHGRG
ncbi:MAG: hypothetical protein AABX27_05180 [Nanoarchaeota archaeon]